ncbi:50S ribosomal protein L7ae [Entomoplasma ellychniae]|uniref:50S ribosomal protein L7ae n=1 Tax=Entomoplasma ellychniae TaxID=2114 RepID=A0A8E2UB10_9MOLU|nr:ribosomal L7Ae/L30e/S12e/Gadd45 family protein [Entomoplasma ellychniae]PPE05086.1 50S ribosomal protein L7ae [Entomoplasma ellychniae]
MNKSKLLNAIGMCYAANKIIKGEQLLDAIKKNKVKLVILSSNMGSSQKKKFIDKCTFYNIEYYTNLITVEEMITSFANKNVVALGVNDPNFIKLIKSNI